MSTRRVRLTALGWDEDLTIESLEEAPSQPMGDQVLVEIEACGVCYRDCIDRAGGFKFIQLPITPGHEAVGHVRAVGAEVTDWIVGDRVATMHRDFCGECIVCREGKPSLCQKAVSALGLIIDGGYASHMLAPQRALFRVPEEILAEEAAVLHCTFGTSYRGLAQSARVGAGEHVLVTGANGGVGTAAIQVARRLGARVTAVVRDDSHAESLRALGADVVLVDPGGGFHKRLEQGPADAVMECVGNPTFNSALRSLRPGGRIVVVGNVDQKPATVNLGYLVTKGIQVMGSSGAARSDMAAVLKMHADEPFDVQVHARMNLSEADRAQRLVLAGGLHGRIVLVPERA